MRFVYESCAFLFSIQILKVTGDAPTVPAWEPSHREAQFWQNYHQTFLNTTQAYGPKIQAIFLGDSLTHLYANQGKEVWKKYYGNVAVVNYGIGGDDTRNILWRITNGEIDGMENAKLVVLMIGANNLAKDKTEDIAKGIKKIIETLNKKLPKTKILLLGLLPLEIGKKEMAFLITADINFRIKEFDNGNSIRFFNMWTDFGESFGAIKSEYFINDKVHLSEAGYSKWAKLMDPLFKEMMA